MGSVSQWFTKLGLMIARQQALTTDAEGQAIFFLPRALWIAKPSSNPVHRPHSEQCQRRRRGDRQR